MKTLIKSGISSCLRAGAVKGMASRLIHCTNLFAVIQGQALGV